MNLILNILLVVVTLNAIIGARFTAELDKANAAKYGAKFLAYRGISTLAILGIWVWLAIESGYWQFAALSAIAVLLTAGIVAGTPKAVKP